MSATGSAAELRGRRQPATREGWPVPLNSTRPVLTRDPAPLSTRRPKRFPHPCLRLLPVTAALALWAADDAAAQAASAPSTGLLLQASPSLQPPPRGEAAKQLPIILLARELRGRPDLETVAEGDAELRRGGMVIRADRLSYDPPDDLAQARGNVRITRDGNVFSGPELQLKVQRFEGFFVNPTFYFGQVGAGGVAERLDFLGERRAVATRATYSSCPPDGTGGPAWLLTTRRVKLDFDANEGIAEGAVLRFLGVPILAAPVLSFPLTDARKSGWLPPNINIDSKSGLQVSVPYYWNLAPNRDATLTPTFSSRRSLGLDSEFRYLEPRYSGSATLNLLPNDRTTGRSRYAANVIHDADLVGDTRLQLNALRVSDDEYWKDFARSVPSITPRLLASDLRVSRPFGAWSTYARVQKWQLLQSLDAPVTAPYERVPNVGARTTFRFGSGFEASFEGEFNRFANPDNLAAVDRQRVTGLRLHALGSLALPFAAPGWSVTPRLSFNAASYALDSPLTSGTFAGRSSVSRVIPSFSLDSSWVFERDSRWFGQAMRQTLEPRVLYVNTPFREQSGLPNFDAAAKDFNFESIYSDNAFSGVDRVSDAHQLTAGVTTRVLDPLTGAEALRLGVVQRVLFRDQRITPDGQPFTQRFSDVLLLASTSLVKHWTLDASVQYSPNVHRTARSVVGARYSPGPFRTVNATYRLAPGAGEQVELGWQWPVYGPTAGNAPPLVGRSNPSCRGTWYSVGRINYSTSDSRVTGSVLGLEYDAGCWIGRVVAERLSTGRSEATTRLLLQLELVGLSRLGSNPLQVLKDNIPGYRLLRDGPLPSTPSTPNPPL